MALAVVVAAGLTVGPGARPAGAVAAQPAARGYWFVGADGGVFGFGGAQFFGSTGAITLNKPIVGMATTRSGRGYWLVASDGGVFAFGDAVFRGSTGALALKAPIVGMAATPSGAGYWLVASDGGVFAFGDAVFSGSTGAITLNKPIVGMAGTPTGRGYWLVASDGGVFSFGDAVFRGSSGAIKLNKPIVGMATTPSGRGYWQVASDGGIFAFGDAEFKGSMGAVPLNKPIVAIASTPRGVGYWMVASDGGVFSFGDAAFAGSTGGQRLTSPIVGVVAPPVRTTPEVPAFFYPWYGRPDRDGEWRHWEGNGHMPPDDFAANFAPARGLYSSTDPGVLAAQMADMAGAGIDLVVTSWWGRGSFEDKGLQAVLAAAASRRMRVAVHIEPYAGRSVSTVEQDVAYLRSLGVRDVWLYNIQGFPAAELALARSRMGVDMRVMGNGTNPAAYRSGAFASFAQAAGLDGIYTYDAVRYTPSDFATVCAAARQANLLCSASVSPGYVANRTKPGDAQVVSREGGARYDATWVGAVNAASDIVSVTSYNEWHEGTQIEGAVPFCFPEGICSAGYDGAYGTGGAAAQGAYLSRTAFWSSIFHGL
ncbi:MAG TPA: hypothetical protein VHM89_04530 [Acidimicrobiales bacterium]|nr:hypothetical protein [Acidimicrobiales bacterium]